ncbi:MAG: AI-2E family transporter [Candidatus Uhrbacteria bacterium]
MSQPSIDRPHTVTVSTWTILKIILIILALGLVWFLREVAAMIFVALLFSALIDPFADWLARHKIPRVLAVIIVYAMVLILAFSVLILLVPPLISQFQQLLDNSPTIFSGLNNTFSRFKELSTQYGFEANFQAGLDALQVGFNETFYNLFSTITGFFGGLAACVIVLVLTFYMVVEEESARRFFKNLAPVEYQPFLTAMFIKMQKRIGYWLRGQLVLGLVVGLAVYLGLLIIGVPYPLLLGLIAGLLEIVPYAGPLLAAIPALIIAFSVSPLTGIAALVVCIVVQQIENNILVPKIMQKATGLNPIVSIVVLMVGIKFGGFVGGDIFGSVVGALLAIPVATMLSVAVEEFFAEHSSREK